MGSTVAIRSARDRLRYALLFEIFLMALVVPVGALFFERSLANIGLLMLILCMNAMICNLVYNWVLDRIDARQGRVASERNWKQRMLHAAGFEVLLTLISLPIKAYWLDIAFIEALSVNIVLTSFVVVYTYVFTFAYDAVFPLAGTLSRQSGNMPG
ncbi:PACE efflux transporter [Marinibacterium sp. SX1]|uniref:PACE efflux transporter n=1 Tax=Marinibacterium sp. SX1 TaxID=3388424 RepID=UPI003D167822